MKTLENAQFSQSSRETHSLAITSTLSRKLQIMHSLASKFYVKCRFCLQNTVSAAKFCKDWKMHSLAKFQHENVYPAKFLRKRRVCLASNNASLKFYVKCRFCLKTQFPLLNSAQFSQIFTETSSLAKNF